ncbi:MAG: 50S ribosomal protein L11 methyltransferase [Agriterribacter sp.]
MGDKYIKISVLSDDKNLIEVLNAMIVNELNIDGIEEHSEGLSIYTTRDKLDESILKNICDINAVNYSISEIKETNWNAEWEKNFEPVVVDDFVSILADFHDKIAGVEHEILITPKMSFGTGHHATTYMMVAMMRLYGCADLKVIDFGTGTGILAILAEKMGAERVAAIDCDDWSIENAAENIERNNCKMIELVKADRFIAREKVDLILANINLHVILENLNAVSAALRKDGTVIFSGILTTDIEEITKQATERKLLKLKTMEKNNWACIAFKKG